VTAAAKRRALPYTAWVSRSSDRSGWNWSIDDARTGLTLRSGWLAGTRREVDAEVRYWASRYYTEVRS